MALDVIQVDGLGNTRYLVQFPQVIRQVGVINDALQVAFEMAEIHRVEAYQGGEQTPVGFSDLCTTQVALFR